MSVSGKVISGFTGFNNPVKPIYKLFCTMVRVSCGHLATCCLLLTCKECVFTVIVVTGKDETALYNLLEITNRCFKTLQGMTHPLQLEEMLASMTRTQLSLCAL